MTKHLRRGVPKIIFRAPFPRRTVRLRLTLLYGGLFLVSGALLLAITYVLVAHQILAPIHIQLVPAKSAHSGIVRSSGGTQVAKQLQSQQSGELYQLLITSGLALAIMAAVSIGLGWIVAGRTLRPLRKMTTTTRQISEDNLHERLALQGPSDEIKDLGDTIDGLLGRLEGAFDAQRRFVANASHELRTPLTLGRAMLQVALADPTLTIDSLRSTCEEVIEAGAEQEQMIEALLTLARSQRGLDHKEPVDLTVIVKNVLNAHEPAWTAQGLTVDAAFGQASVFGDARLIERSVWNLVENALRHNVPNGYVDVTVGTRASHATVKVVNSGPGIPADQVERLLQPFQRLDAERQGKPDGLGLGLAIVAAIAKAHGATLGVRPGPTGGLDVELSFPVSGDRGSAPGAVETHLESGSTAY